MAKSEWGSVQKFYVVHPRMAHRAIGLCGDWPMTVRENTTLLFYPRHSSAFRLLALWYFAGLLIVWNILGHTVLGFEQAWAHPFIGVASALFFQIVLDWV